LSQTQWRDVLYTADLAAVLLLSIHTDPRSRADSIHPDSWLDPSHGRRAEIQQATGMVLVQLGISATEALARLRAHAFATDRLLIDVSTDVVDRRLVFTDDME
jgi:hypothetical protein